MKTTFRILLLAGILAVSACATSEREMPKNSGSGTDTMKLSPCACLPVPYDGSGFAWRG